MAQKGTDRGRCTYFLKMAEGETCQDTERNQPSEGHSPSGDGRGRDLSRHGKKKTKRGALTFWRGQKEGLVRTRKEADRARGTHILETAEGGTGQNTERNQPSEAHSHTEDRRGRDFVRTQKEANRERRAHWLETAKGGICQGTERKRSSEGAHSLETAERGTCHDT